MKPSHFLKAVTLITMLAAGFAQAAETPVYDTPTTTSGNQNFNGVLGNDFTVNSSGLTVTSLGAFNSTHTGFTTNVTTRLYDITALDWASSAVNFNGMANITGASYVYQSIAAVGLIAGHTYSIESWGFNDTDLNYNTNIIPANNPSNTNVTSPITFNTLGGALSNGNSRYDAAQNILGASVFEHSSTFGAGSLLISAVPEPETYAMLLAGLGLVGFMSRRKSAKKAA